MNKLIANITITYAASGLGFVVLILLARLLGAVQFAWVALGLALGGLIMPLASLGSQRIFVRDAISLKDTKLVGHMADRSFGMQLTTAVLVTLLVVAGGSFYAERLEEVVALCGFSMWVGLQGLYPTGWFDYLNETRMQNTIVLTERLAAIFFVALVYFVVEEGRIYAAFIGVVLLLTRVVSITYQVRKWKKIGGDANSKIYFKWPSSSAGGVNFRIAFTLLANSMVSYGNQVLLADTNALELSAYSLSFQIITLIFLFQTLIIRLKNRKIAEVVAIGIGIRRAFFGHACVLALGSAVLGCIVFVITAYLPVVLGDDRYSLMSEFIPVLWVWIVVAGVGQAVTQYLLEMRQEGFYTVTGICGGILAFSTGCMFVPENGAIAVAVILLLVHGTMILTNFTYLLVLLKRGIRG